MRQYKLLSGEDPTDLEVTVNAYVEAGWVATGGVAIASNGTFYQAVVHFGWKDKE